MARERSHHAGRPESRNFTYVATSASPRKSTIDSIRNAWPKKIERGAKAKSALPHHAAVAGRWRARSQALTQNAAAQKKSVTSFPPTTRFPVILESPLASIG